MTLQVPKISLTSNAGRQPPLEAGATQERTLEAVGWTPWLDAAPAKALRLGNSLPVPL